MSVFFYTVATVPVVLQGVYWGRCMLWMVPPATSESDNAFDHHFLFSIIPSANRAQVLTQSGSSVSTIENRVIITLKMNLTFAGGFGKQRSK